jgi:hypothetical protein
MAEILVEIPDPLARTEKHRDQPRLLIDAPVKVWFDGRKIPDAVRLPREYVRDDETVWVMEEGKLDLRNVDVARRDATYAYIRAGLSESDRVVTTKLTTVTDGAALRTEPTEEPDSSSDPRQIDDRDTQ